MLDVKNKKDLFTEVYLDYYPLVFSSVLTKIDHLDDARDICQEVFMIFYEKMNEIENHRPWLIGTLRNVVLRYYQKKRSDIDNIDDIEFTFVNGEREARMIIKEAIEHAKCDDIDRLMLDLIAVHKFSYNTVAGLLGLTRRQVEYRYGQVVQRILDHLRDKGIKDLSGLL